MPDERDVVKPDWASIAQLNAEARDKAQSAREEVEARLKDLEQSVQELEQENEKLKAIAKQLSDCLNAARFVLR
jgi:hypothetical protein